MTRLLCSLTVGGLLLFPHGSNARGGCPPFPPVVYYPPPVVIYYPCVPQPVYQPALPPPQVVPEKKAEAPKDDPPTVKPVEFVAPKKPSDEPPTLPKMDVPSKPVAVDPPKLDPPKVDPKPGDLPPIKLPAFESPPANPKPAESKSGDIGLPAIVLPQLSGKSESKYLSGPTVDELVVDGPAPAGDRQVGFYNYTGRSLTLTVGKASVAVPARSYVTASLPASFTWAIDGGAERKTTMPTDSAGVEIVIK